MLQAIGLLVLVIVEIVVVIWAMIDAIGRPKSAWHRAGQNKLLWVALQPFGLVFVVGLIIPVVYFSFIRPSVRRAQTAISKESY